MEPVEVRIKDEHDPLRAREQLDRSRKEDWFRAELLQNLARIATALERLVDVDHLECDPAASDPVIRAEREKLLGAKS